MRPTVFCITSHKLFSRLLINKHFVFCLHVFSLFEFIWKFSLLIIFWVFSLFSGGFLRPTRLWFANKLMPNGSRPNVFHDTASRRFASSRTLRRVCVALSWVEGGPTRNQLAAAAAAQPTNCDTNSDRAQRRWLRLRLRQQQQLIRQRELFYILASKRAERMPGKLMRSSDRL